jgi:hypothetical protein
MTETVKPTSWWTTGRVVAVAALAALVAVVVWVLVAQAGQASESDRRVDRYYCSMSGIDATDRGPETGELCADLLYGD